MILGLDYCYLHSQFLNKTHIYQSYPAHVSLSTSKTSELEIRIEVFLEPVAWLKLDEQRPLRTMVSILFLARQHMHLLADWPCGTCRRLPRL